MIAGRMLGLAIGAQLFSFIELGSFELAHLEGGVDLLHLVRAIVRRGHAAERHQTCQQDRFREIHWITSFHAVTPMGVHVR